MENNNYDFESEDKNRENITPGAQENRNIPEANVPPAVPEPRANSDYHYSYTGNKSPEENRKQTKKRGLFVFASIVIAAALLFTGAVAGVTVVDYFRSNEIKSSTGNGGGTQQTTDTLPENSVKLQIQDSPAPASQVGSANASSGLETSLISEKVKPSVVGIVSEITSDMSATAQGSGIIMSQDGYVITNNHVIDGANKITVILESGKKYSAKVKGKDAKTDLAVLKIDAAGLPAAIFGNSDQLKVGDKAVAIGNPMGMELQGTVTQGIISAINRNITVEDRVMTLLQTDASINPGNSGGPLVNKYGQVIGINTVKISVQNYEGLGFAIPMNTAKPVIDELIAYGYVKGRPAIGISGRDMTERAANYYGVPMGVLVDTVDEKSDAYAKGLRSQDIIYAVNGKTITSMSEIQSVKEKMKVGQTLTLGIYRNGNKFNITIKLVDEATLDSSSSSPQQITPDILPTP
ncbi:MAG: trypsin-like peptidase domain-containing protein [Bacillota bacterium]|nr:trypsin-like peptidase domain-containing protein [Bacillota bacterium]